MKKQIVILLLFIPFILRAQDSFTLVGKVGKDNAPAKAYLLYRDGKKTVTDSAKIINGVFKFTGTIHEPVPARLIIDHKGVGFAKTSNTADMMMMFLSKGTINIKSADSLKRAVFPGSVINAEYNKYKAYMAQITKQRDKIYSDYRNASEQDKKDAIFQKKYQEQAHIAENNYEARQLAYVKANPNTYVSLYELREAANPIVDVPLIEPLFNGLSEKLKSSISGRELKAMIDKRRALSIGQYAPAFTQNDQYGHPVSLADFKGKYVLIDFWASWCAPCRAENPNVVKAYNHFKDKNFTVLSVSLDRPGRKADWLAAIKADNLTWTQVSDLNFWNNQVALLYGIKSVPQNFLLDKEGKIIAEDLRGEALEKKLTELLK